MSEGRTTTRPAPCARLICGALALLGAVAAPAPASAQRTPDALAETCTTAGGSASACGLAGAVALAAQGRLALLGGLGSEIAGTATTLGTRVQGGPRLTFTGRAALAGGGLPDPGSPLGDVGGSARALHAEAAIGLFEGFRLMPTVGGFLSVDAFGRAAFVFLPESGGYPGRTSVYTAGVRVGILREGFTLPGVSLSASRRFVGGADVGGAGDEVRVRVDPGVSSIRATVGKDVFAVEWLAGFGWDDFGGDVAVTASDGAAGSVELAGAVDGSRRIWFASASRTFSIVLNVALEAGWAEGFDPIASYAGDYDPTARVLFGGVSARLVF